jgi:phosphate starvation-inducible PhoH-like protein
MLVPKTANQIIYVKKLLSLRKPIVVAAGPAGCGKTLFACQIAAQRLLANQYDKIVITRPTVSVDEDLGFLPGKLEKKMEPWVKPMFEIFERERVHKSVEIVPMAYMRGRTFRKSFIIADEMQNSTRNQMKMVLTRIGDDSKMVVTGDLNQSDLTGSSFNGLYDLFQRISENENLEYIDQIMMTGEDIQRHPAVSEVLSIY